MKGTFKITLDYLKELGACKEGQQEFRRVFPDGGEYQEVLDRCAAEGRLDFGRWLLKHVGPTDDVRRYDEDVDTPDKIIMFAGQIEFKGCVTAQSILAGRRIHTGWDIIAGEGIKAGWGIEAGEGIEAGWDINAGEGIKAGEDYAIFAGLNIPLSLWKTHAVVTARSKPDNLRSGHWVPMESR